VQFQEQEGSFQTRQEEHLEHERRLQRFRERRDLLNAAIAAARPDSAECGRLQGQLEMLTEQVQAAVCWAPRQPPSPPHLVDPRSHAEPCPAAQISDTIAVLRANAEGLTAQEGQNTARSARLRVVEELLDQCQQQTANEVRSWIAAEADLGTTSGVHLPSGVA
jgi:hypothetical protein